MTYKEKQRYLNEYVYCLRNIEGLQREASRWEAIATNITQKISPVIVNTNDNNSKVENCAIKCCEIQEKIAREMQKAEDRRAEIFGTIQSVKDLRKREVLEMRYVYDMSVHQIAIKLGKADDNIYKMLRTTIKTMDI